MRSKKLFLILLPVMIFIIAVLIRLKCFFSMPINGDEFFTLAISEKWIDGLRSGFISLPKSHTVFFDLFCGLFYAILPDPVIAIRLPALIATITSLIVFFFMIRSRFGYAAALSTLVILTFYPVHVWYSWYARSYSFAFLFGGISLLYCFSAIEKRSLRHLFLCLLFIVLGGLSHPVAIFALCVGLFYLGTLVILTINKPNERVLRLDLFGKTISLLGIIGIAAGIYLAIHVLSTWKFVSSTQFDYSPAAFLLGWGIDYGIPLCLCGLIVMFYFFLHFGKRAYLFSLLSISVPLLMLIFFGFIHISIAPVYAYACGIALPLAFGIFIQCIADTKADKQRFGGVNYVFICTALVVVCAFGPVMTLISDLRGDANGNLRDAIRWIDADIESKPCVICLSSTGGAFFWTRQLGINALRMNNQSSLDEIRQELQQGKTIVISNSWLALLPKEELAKCSFPLYFVIGTDDGITPNTQDSIRQYAKYDENGKPLPDLEAIESMKKRLEREFSLQTRIGKPRLDHRNHYLLVYRNKTNDKRRHSSADTL